MIFTGVSHDYEDIISIDNLLDAWTEFNKGKRYRKDVLEFKRHLMINIINLHHSLKSKTYTHGGYEAFNISDPKPRNIHKASVRDRLLHHAIYRKLYFHFDRKFIHDSYSCRHFKGTHKALKRFEVLARKASKNHHRTCFVLKCDIRKFFASIDHDILISILEKHLTDKDTLWLLTEIIKSFYSTREGVGLPLGNLTSQLLVNIYMNEFDQFVKHKLKVKYYIRYADDFVVLSDNKNYLETLLLEMQKFLREKLRLEMHPDKVYIKTIASGVDFLGWVHFPDHRVLRTVTKRRMFKRLVETENSPDTAQSYLGLLKHGNGWKLEEGVRNMLK